MNELQIFNYGESQVRTVKLNSEVWFVAIDVCQILNIRNVTQAMSRLDDDERAMFDIGRQGESNIINESGLYNLILRSDKPEAKTFKKWVTSEVLPSIRKTGSYMKPMTNSEMLLAMAQAQVESEKRINQAIEIAQQATSRVEQALEIFSEKTDRSWREDMNKKIRKICQENGLSYVVLYGDLYKELEGKASCNLKTRQKNLRERMTGSTYAERQAISKIDVVERDPKLKAIFEGIVRKYQVKYAAVAQ